MTMPMREGAALGGRRSDPAEGWHRRAWQAGMVGSPHWAWQDGRAGSPSPSRQAWHVGMEGSIRSGRGVARGASPLPSSESSPDRPIHRHEPAPSPPPNRRRWCVRTVSPAVYSRYVNNA